MSKTLECELLSLSTPATIVGHLAPDLDCLTAIWILMRFGGAKKAELAFVPAGDTLDARLADSDPHVVHVDTGGGRFDHHSSHDPQLCAAELVRRATAPNDAVLKRLVDQVIRSDNAQLRRDERPLFFNINDLIAGYNALYPNRPQHVTQAMLPNLDAWYEHEARQHRLDKVFERRMQFHTRWGMGIAMESSDGGSSRLAYGEGAILYAYRDGKGHMGIAAQSRSDVDLAPVYSDLLRVDEGADWYLHPNRRLLLCGTAKAPARNLSQLTLEELVGVIKRS
ncbi:MAG: hypothetical protein H7Y32_07255 [Chloroflexales bacterium]|nr:hypothetical protein [Chloroflexales bacterium]